MSVLGHGTSFTLKRPIQKRQINNSDQTETAQECVIMWPCQSYYKHINMMNEHKTLQTLQLQPSTASAITNWSDIISLIPQQLEVSGVKESRNSSFHVRKEREEREKQEKEESESGLSRFTGSTVIDGLGLNSRRNKPPTNPITCTSELLLIITDNSVHLFNLYTHFTQYSWVLQHALPINIIIHTTHYMKIILHLF